MHRHNKHAESTARIMQSLTGFKLYCFMVSVSGILESVVDCDSQRKKVEAEAGYMYNVPNQLRYLTIA